MNRRRFIGGLVGLVLGITCTVPKEESPRVTRQVRPFAQIMSGYVDNYANQAQVDALLEVEARKNNIDWRFAKAVLIKESHYDAGYVSTSGAVGLMQLMPRKGSHYTTNYNNYVTARKQRRDRQGKRWYKGKTAQQWADAYRAELIALRDTLGEKELFEKDKRFEPAWNIQSGVAQLADEYHHFRKRHGDRDAMRYAAAAYNAGRGAVQKGGDHVPKNGQTELYVPKTMEIFDALIRGNGRILKKDKHVLSL